MFHPLWRQHALDQLDDGFDVIVIGGGITGAGVLLDAAQRGLRTLLVERGDLASGTSSRSSKLIHGGLRYLKEMQFRTTRHACRERDLMVNLSPHLVDPIRFLYPAYRNAKTPGWQVDIGLWLYDRLTQQSKHHAHLEPEEVQELVPGLNTEELDEVMAYYDARADDARVTLAVAATGFAFGGLVLTRAEVMAAVRDSRGRIAGVEIRDLETARVHRIEASVVVNAAGVWVDNLRERLGCQGTRLRPSRGSHLIFAPDRLPLQAAVTVPSPDDGRPVFIIPHPEGILAGTTDIFHEGSLDDPRATPEEIGYILRTIQAAFPHNPPQDHEIRGAFAGLRPILDTHAENPSEASRDEDIWEEHGMVSVAGGKLTTWRSTAEDVVDSVLPLLPEERARKTAACATAGTPLSGLAPRDLSTRLKTAHGIDTPVALGMARRLGQLAWSACLLAKDPSELEPYPETEDVTPAELRAHLRFSAVLHLDDLLLRRARVGMWTPDRVPSLVPRLESLMKEELGWGGARWHQEQERLHRKAAAWRPST
jgi:glycerol-3-phosphate dehydrogenase